MRLFIAIEIPTNIRTTFAAFLKEMRDIAPRAKWVRPENLHVTLKFLGHTDAGNLEKIQSSLRAVRSALPVTLELKGLGFFPNENRPRVFWAGMESSANLRALAEDIDRTMHPLGFPLENRAFAPHLTLARFNPPGLPPKISEAVQRRATHSFGAFTADIFHLIESKLKPTGAEYTTVQSFPFVAENQL